MTEPRLPTHLWVMAEIKRCNALGLPTYLVRRGDAERGTVLRPSRELTYADLAARKFDPHASVALALDYLHADRSE